MNDKAIRQRRELCEAIMAAALAKVEALGFYVLLRDTDRSNSRMPVRNHVLFHRMEFIFTDHWLHNGTDAEADRATADPKGPVPTVSPSASDSAKTGTG